MSKQNGFYESLLSRTNEKTASAQTRENITASLNKFSPDELMKIAEEIQGLSSETEEEKATEAARQAGSTKAEEAAAAAKSDNGSGIGAEDAAKAQASTRTTSETVKEDGKKNAEGIPTSDDGDDSEYEVTAAQQLYAFLKEAAADEDINTAIESLAFDYAEQIIKSAEVQEELQSEIEKRAFEMTEQVLGSLGITKQAFVEAFIGDEKIASDIVEQSEKLAAYVEEPFTKIASELINKIYGISEE